MQLGNHRSALSILVHDLRDATSAEAYCALSGDVVPGKIAQAIGDKYGLQLWSSTLFSLPTSAAMSRTTSTATIATSKGNTSAVLMGRQKSGVDESVKKGLLKVLLEVYMNDGCVCFLSLCLVNRNICLIPLLLSQGISTNSTFIKFASYEP
jgi:hypothetical protein